jgi:hypothetical protein
VLPQPFEVDVSHEGASLVGPILVAVGAIIASGLTAALTVLFANRRHREQLKADRDLHLDQLRADRVLQKDQLEHDRGLQLQQLEANEKRLERQLAYDREIRFREAVQGFLDEVLERERSLRYFLDEYVYAVDRAEDRRLQIESDSDLSGDAKTERIKGLHEELLKKRTEASRRIFDAIGDSILLRIRTGQNDVVVKHGAVLSAMRARIETIPAGDDWQLRSDRQKEEEATAEEESLKPNGSFFRPAEPGTKPGRSYTPCAVQRGR